ncbi:ubiquinone biosynthesis O-methyltransferase [Obba rivulosa]|uniref:Ubiquinone biosynthesis O-methyltransferase, mitochondrial n=1 Tax=Obba rivulosa TaxID=1052685 RepID=A0A8E2DHR7_9APHY|nr:ubiquinone biosynthesis O-methyltransferase [Obba rivulosa]
MRVVRHDLVKSLKQYHAVSQTRCLIFHSRRCISSTARTPQAADASPSSVNPDEIAHFSRLSSLWWDERGEFGLLHKMNPVRMQFIRDKVLEMRREDEGELSAEQEQRVLEGIDVVDVGCGGGLLCESLTRLGGNTLGIDASSSNIAIASLHASFDPSLSFADSASRTSPPPETGPRRGRLRYEHTSVEDLLAREGPKRFDVVCSMEVLEHVDNPRAFLRNCAELVKPGGHLFLSTISRTPLAYLLTIFAAEHLLRLVTPGTHTYAKYIKPAELLDFFAHYRSPAPAALASPAAPAARESRPWISRLYNGVPARTEAETRGIVYVPWNGEWVLVPRAAPGKEYTEAVNYLFWVRRPLEA